MLVVMAFQALVELDLVESVFPFRYVTLRAFQFRVLAGQRILRGSMRLHIEFRRLPSGDLMAGRALARIGALRKLPIVRVFVAVRALRELELLLEVAVRVAGTARDR